MSTHNICFHAEIRKIYQYFLVGKSALSGAMLFSITMFVCIFFLLSKISQELLYLGF